MSRLEAAIRDGKRVTAEEALEIYDWPLARLGKLADERRNQAKGADYGGRGKEVVTYMVDRNINYTNVCDVYCKFCAFYRTEKDADHYVLSQEQIDGKIEELLAVGVVGLFREAGLGSIPGGGAEILVDRVRQKIAPRKCDTEGWLKVMEIAHGMGMRSSATMMFGHVETPAERIEHLGRLRDLQDRTGGFTAFICWTFQPENTILKVAKMGSHEYLRMQALSRIFLDNIPNVQSSWVTQGPAMGQVALKFGANDFGSLMMEENVVSSAGTSFRLSLDEMRRLIREAGYEPWQRNNEYELLGGAGEGPTLMA